MLKTAGMALPISSAMPPVGRRPPQSLANVAGARSRGKVMTAGPDRCEPRQMGELTGPNELDACDCGLSVTRG